MIISIQILALISILCSIFIGWHLAVHGYIAGYDKGWEECYLYFANAIMEAIKKEEEN